MGRYFGKPMRIIFIQSFATDRATYGAGQTHDVTPDVAGPLIRAGIAAEDVPPVPETESRDTTAVDTSTDTKPAKPGRKGKAK